MVTVATDADFSTQIGSHEKVVVKYFAHWCGTCRLFSPKFKKMSDREEFKDVLFLDVNAEENPDARKLAGVTSLPWFAVFKNGNLLAAESTSKEEAVESLVKKLYE